MSYLSNQENGKEKPTRKRRPHDINLAPSPMVGLAPIRAPPHPRLIDVNARPIGHHLPLPALQLDLHGPLPLRALHLAEPHALAYNGLVPRVLQVLLDLAGGLLLAEAHLHDRRLDRLAGNLPRQRAQLLDRRLQHVRL